VNPASPRVPARGTQQACETNEPVRVRFASHNSLLSRYGLPKVAVAFDDAGMRTWPPWDEVVDGPIVPGHGPAAIGLANRHGWGRRSVRPIPRLPVCDKASASIP
jgi:hypothetical protein